MLIYKNPQRQWLAGAEQELAQRLQERAMLDQRIAELQQTIEALRTIVGDANEMAKTSLPMLCLRVLSFSLGRLQSVPLIKQGLEAIGITIPGNNPLAVLHTALGRLAVKGYAEAESPKPGTAVQYRITQAGLAALQDK